MGLVSKNGDEGFGNGFGSDVGSYKNNHGKFQSKILITVNSVIFKLLYIKPSY